MHTEGVPTKLQGSMDPTELMIQATLYVRVPFAGRIKITSISGSLKSASIKAVIDAVVAKGTAELSLDEGYLAIALGVTVRLVGSITLPKLRLWKF